MQESAAASNSNVAVKEQNTCLLMTSEDRYYMYKFALVTDPDTGANKLVLTRPKDANSDQEKN